MIELISNSAHNSEVYVYLNRENSGRRFARKLAMTPRGMSAMERESAGWSWYAKRRFSEQQVPIQRWIEKPGCVIWELEWIDGRVPQIDKGIGPNREFLLQALEHYIAIWPKKKGSVPMHGDFSLVNFIFNSRGMCVLDWESFEENGPPWGFDPLYLVFETLWYARERSGHIHSSDYEFITDCVNKLTSTNLLEENFVNSPLSNLKAWIGRFPVIQAHRPIMPPVLQFLESEASQIDHEIRQRLRHLP